MHFALVRPDYALHANERIAWWNECALVCQAQRKALRLYAPTLTRANAVLFGATRTCIASSQE